ncbi:MAG: (2Fe-2S)-binding protein [Epsilonproteobacteria bacterium]|nr:(2Fe-2S)-binding protein [Campylobacterota bacterium]
MSSIRNIEPKTISVTIDGNVCDGVFGQTILEIARENDIYIPTMCYLTKVLPIASCRMCVVDVEGVEGMILSCQEKATDGAVINTQNAELHKERQNIMKLYNVNHPLECGVCDKSGECDLQNKTMEFGVSGQNFTTKEPSRPVQNWGPVSYDPALCIMCEKCVRVSTEITGDEALKVKFGGYSSTIENVAIEANHKTLGEAAAVCPVGALVDTSFKYTSNAWELTKIPSSCPHCGGGHEVIYEVKHGKVMRVSNNAEFTTLCSASRYGYDFANENVTKDEAAFKNAIEAFESAKSICFSSQISNEEALILQKLKEQKGYKLISNEARAYQKFMNAYGSVTGKSLYGGSLEAISKSRAVIVMGTRINDDAPIVKYHINMASKWQRARVAYMHPIEDNSIQNIVTQFIKYEAGSEEGVASLLVNTLLKDIEVPENIRTVLNDLDIGNLAAESNIGEEELEALAKSLIKKVGFSLVVGADLYAHPKAENIAKTLALLEKYAGFNVICVPPAGNALGVSLICDLDDEVEGATVGYNVKGDFTLSALGDGDLDMPSLIQQEGTLTSLSKRVVPMNVAVAYGGYVLSDIANALGLNAEYTIDYTKELPTAKGFEAVEFDALPNYFDAKGVEHRGYLLNEVEVDVDTSIKEPADINGIDGAVIYNCNPQEHFSAFTGKSKKLMQEANLLGSQQFATAAKLSDGESVSLMVDNIEFTRVFKIDTSLKGTIALNPTFDMGLSTALLSSYRFSRLERVGS